MPARYQPNEVAFALAFVAGFIFIGVGWSGQRGIDRLVDLLRGVFGPSPVLRVLAVIMLSIAYLGGVAVILGGIAILKDHVWGGRALIYLGAGGGLITLIAFAWLLLTRTEVVAVHEGFLPAFAGLALCVAAQWKAKAR